MVVRLVLVKDVTSSSAMPVALLTQHAKLCVLRKVANALKVGYPSNFVELDFISRDAHARSAQEL